MLYFIYFVDDVGVEVSISLFSVPSLLEDGTVVLNHGMLHGMYLFSLVFEIPFSLVDPFNEFLVKFLVAFALTLQTHSQLLYFEVGVSQSFSQLDDFLLRALVFLV